MSDILPDSRARVTRGAKIGVWGIYWIPIYCANCGADGGTVPEENMTHCFYLCQPCSQKYGAVADTYMEPDRVFWNRVNAEMLEQHGRYLTPEEVQAERDAGLTPLAALLREGAS